MAHYYIVKNGIPQRYVQLKKDGTPSKRINRGKALADGAFKGTTDTLKVLGDSSGLCNWYGKLGIQAGLESPDEDTAKARLKELSEDAANKGTAIHDAIDNYFKTGELPSDHVQKTACVYAKSFLESKGMSEYGSEHCFVFKGYINIMSGEVLTEETSEEGWVLVATGGTADIVSDKYIIDWKTVEKKRGKYRDPYAKECSQSAIYGIGFDRPYANIINVQ